MADQDESRDNTNGRRHPVQVSTGIELFDVVDRSYNGVTIELDESSGIYNNSPVSLATLASGISGWLLLNGPAAYLKVLATRLGERHADAMERKLLLRSRSHGRRLVIIFDPHGENFTIEANRAEFTDTAWLALLDLIPTMSELGGAVLVWDAKQEQWVTETQR
jgi:hypothetical protein